MEYNMNFCYDKNFNVFDLHITADQNRKVPCLYFLVRTYKYFLCSLKMMKRKKAFRLALLSSSENFIDPNILTTTKDPFDTIVNDLSTKLKNRRYKKREYVNKNFK